MIPLTTKSNHKTYWNYVSSVLFEAHWVLYLLLDGTILFPLVVDETQKNELTIK
ncbi:hypothetical protein DNHGIG_40380 [Collibacillus ludicampi]|uniref:Uncharacterized protein n=1 Tax=Collibacillus ludicampi TaxID=2771369 RepID=A0AAV4LMW9_9BACL|nr:hypothetical protein [Collibacillus ludicampi]GIM48489.1 hypothetical protein DNHGIG_40380 [Collibacillus ludicampi]